MRGESFPLRAGAKSGEAESFPLPKRSAKDGSVDRYRVEKRNPFRFSEKSSAGLIPIATKRTSRFAAIIQRSTEPFLI